MPRLIHGDVYCGVILKKFKMSEIDTCISCFERETINHQLLECPYTQEIWMALGVDSSNIQNAIGIQCSREELEIHADLLSSIVVRKSTLPPSTLIELTYLIYIIGICKNNKVKELGKTKLDNHNATGTWVKMSKTPFYFLYRAHRLVVKRG